MDVFTTLGDSAAFRKKELSSKKCKNLEESKFESEFGNYHKIFTDASKCDNNGRTGVGISDLRSVRTCERTSEMLQISNAKLIAILKSVLAIENSERSDVMILTDSLNGFNWVKQGLRNNYLVQLIREQISRMNARNVVLQWIPSHIGVPVNDEADDLVKRGAWLEVISPHKITHSDALFEIRRRMLKNWEADYHQTSLTKGTFHHDVQFRKF